MNKNVKQFAKKILLAANPLYLAAAAAPEGAVLPQNNVQDKKKFVTKTIKIGDQLINYNISQRRHKKTLILQHGAFMNNLTMMGVAELFRGYNVIVPDLPGHGKSVSPRPIESVEELTEIEYNFILELRKTGQIYDDADITYAGWSLGGSIGLELALKEGLLNRLVLISSSYVWKTLGDIPEESFYDIFKNMVFANLPKDMTEERRKWLTENFEDTLSPISVCMNDITAVRKYDVSATLKNISLPTLIVVGAKDNLAVPEYEQTLVDKLQNAKLVVMGNEEHAMVIFNPQKVYREIVSFIEPNRL